MVLRDIAIYHQVSLAGMEELEHNTQRTQAIATPPPLPPSGGNVN